MNINEFLALKQGDGIRNVMTGSLGAVVKVDLGRGRHRTVIVKWAGGTREFSISETSTAWMHWSQEPADRGQS